MGHLFVSFLVLICERPVVKERFEVVSFEDSFYVLGRNC